MNRQRRRRTGTQEATEHSSGQGQGGVALRENESKVMFMEQVDYKMEIEQPAATTKMVLLNRDQLTEDEKREAFKKKLRKYSGLVRPEDQHPPS